MSAADTLRSAGEALYGPRWQSDVARDLGVALRTVRRWANGAHPVPAPVLRELAVLADRRGAVLGRVAARLRESAQDAPAGRVATLAQPPAPRRQPRAP